MFICAIRKKNLDSLWNPVKLPCKDTLDNVIANRKIYDFWNFKCT